MDDKKQIDKFSFIMRVSNNIHNIAELDEAEICQEWTEEQKIPIKSGPSIPPPKTEKKEGTEEAKKEGEEMKDEKEPEQPPAPEQKPAE